MKKPILFIFLLFFFCRILHSQPCTPLGDEISYGSNNIWIGYVYDNLNLSNYRGYINEGAAGNPNFDQSFGGDNVLYATNGCSAQTETFSVRYKLTKTFTNATYDFTVGGDDGFRLSLDGGATWVINQWWDQGYTTASYSGALNGTYNMVLEYYENGGGYRVSFNVIMACAGTENTSFYGTNDIWKGYVYDGVNFNSYQGMVQEGSLGNISFDQNFGGSNVQYATTACNVQTETFSVRYRLTKTFTNATYDFTVGGDDGFRLSLDGGATWVINQWWDQGYTTASYSGALNGTYNMILEYYENGGGNRVSFNVIMVCAGTENTSLYGTNDIWKGYVYDGVNFNSYKGMVQEGSLGNISFDQNFGGSNVQYATTACNVQTETFSVRYRLTKTFPFGNYTFIAGGDDGYRLSLDGGITWAIDRWWDQSYTTASYTTNLNGAYNMVVEFYENGGENRISLNMQTNIILSINLLSFKGWKDANSVVLDWDISAGSDPLSFVIERSLNGVAFNPVQTIPAASGSIIADNQHYTYTDATPLPGNSFYRLKMTDLQGKVTYSFVVFIHESVAKTGEITLFPTIITNNIIYCKSGKKINKGIISLTDMYGRLIYRQLIGRIEKGQTVGISTGSNKLAAGIYLVTILDNDEQLITQRILLQ